MKYMTTNTVDIQYPESDGKPMAETELHRDILLALIHALQQYFKDDPQVYVGGNMFLYYEEGKPEASCAPDVFFVRGVPKIRRRTYRVWEEGKAPDLVIELTSKSTRLEDIGIKKGLYEALGVREYYLFDPLNEYLSPALIGYRLEKGVYVPLEPSQGHIESEATGLELGILKGWLRFFDPVTGAPLRTPAESEEAAENAEAARKDAEAARKDAEAARKDAEAARKDAEASLEREKQARMAAEADKTGLAEEVDLLRAQLEQRDSDST